MNIGIDARLLFETGVGRYIRNLITGLIALDETNSYVLFLSERGYESFRPPNSRWQKRLATPRWHTMNEQLCMPYIYLRERLDVLHIPYFSIPILYPKKFIVTIHDLTIMHFPTGKATLLPLPIYAFRHIGYRIILGAGLRRARHIIAVSRTTKKEILDHFPISHDAISVTYEGVDEKLLFNSHESHINSLKQPFFLYVGNAYPHKNLEFLIDAFVALRSANPSKNYRLILVGKYDFFYQRLKTYIQNCPYAHSISLFGDADDEQLSYLYRNARGLMFPSRMEGFGLPGLEALSFRCPLVCSDIPVFREIYEDIPLYFRLGDISSAVHAMQLIGEKGRTIIASKRNTIQKLLKRYSWKKTVIQTMQIYNAVAKSS